MESIVSQKGLGVEFSLQVIVQDAGSTDGTLAILEKYTKKYSCIELYVEKDAGQSDAINRGMKKAQGRICGWLNTDDVLASDALSTVSGEFSSGVSWLIGKCVVIDEQDKPVSSFATSYKEFFVRHFSCTTLALMNYVSQPSTFFLRDMYLTCMLDVSLKYTMDYDLWFRFAKKSSPRIVWKTLAYFRKYNGSTSFSNYEKRFAEEYAVSCRYDRRLFVRLLHKVHMFLLRCVYKMS
jgi:glycosyltransferase involved in cell wall biosynthesis